jgi:hypothetical protein
MQQPPLLPKETLQRVLRLAWFDGLSVLVLGTLFAIGAATAKDVPFAIVGLLATGAGALELHGIALLRRAEARGMSWLIASQPFLFVVIVAYCVLRATHFEMPPLPDNFRQLLALSAEQWHMSIEDYSRMLNRLTVVVFGVVSFFYQGAMTVYYWRRRTAVRRALEAE